MTRHCDTCGASYDAKTSRSRYCSTPCRRRAAYTGQAARRRTLPVVVEPLPVPESLTVVDAVRSALGSAGVLSTPRGVSALVLAQRLDAADSESGAGLAAVARQLDALVAAALGSVDGVDPVDELRIRRRAALAALRTTAAERRAKRDAALTRGAS